MSIGLAVVDHPVALSLGIIFNIMLDKTSKKTKSISVKSSYVENMSRFYRLVVME